MNPVFYFLAAAFAFASDVAETGDVSVVGGDDEIEGQIFGLGGMIRNLFMPHGAYGGYPYGGGSYGNNMMMNAGGYGMNQGHYNSGNNYSNRSGWDRGYNHTDMNHYNNGGFMGSHGNFLGSNGASYGAHFRRLEADFDDEHHLPDFEESEELHDWTDEEMMGEDGDEEIDGQSWRKKYRKYRFPDYRGRTSYHHPVYGGGSYVNPQSNHGGSYGSTAGHYNRGSQYSNQSGWDRGYSHTDSNHFNHGGNYGTYGNHLGHNAGSYGRFY